MFRYRFIQIHIVNSDSVTRITVMSDKTIVDKRISIEIVPKITKMKRIYNFLSKCIIIILVIICYILDGFIDFCREIKK